MHSISNAEVLRKNVLITIRKFIGNMSLEKRQKLGITQIWQTFPVLMRAIKMVEFWAVKENTKTDIVKALDSQTLDCDFNETPYVNLCKI